MPLDRLACVMRITVCGMRHHHNHSSDHLISGLNRLDGIQILNIALVGCPTLHRKMGSKQNERDVLLVFLFFLGRMNNPAQRIKSTVHTNVI
jgi:hypothetical protein